MTYAWIWTNFLLLIVGASCAVIIYYKVTEKYDDPPSPAGDPPSPVPSTWNVPLKTIHNVIPLYNQRADLYQKGTKTERALIGQV